MHDLEEHLRDAIDAWKQTAANQRHRANTAEARVAELEAQLKGMVPWEPRDGWPSREQIQAWRDGDTASWFIAFYGTVDFIVEATIRKMQPDVWSELFETEGFIPAGVVPFRDGRPVSWTEVDSAVEAARKDPTP